MRIRHTLITATALSAVALIAGAAAASAATLNTDGTGFVGKGEVQTAFGWNNKAAAGQPVERHVHRQAADHPVARAERHAGWLPGRCAARHQHATKAGTQAGTRSSRRTSPASSPTAAAPRPSTVTASVTATAPAPARAPATASAPRSASFERFGNRTGTQAGVQTGTFVSALDVTDKKTGQYTGWYPQRLRRHPGLLRDRRSGLGRADLRRVRVRRAAVPGLDVPRRLRLRRLHPVR